MEAVLEMLGEIQGLSFASGFLTIDLSKPCKIPVVGFDEKGNRKEYFLKVTERKGLVLV